MNTSKWLRLFALSCLPYTVATAVDQRPNAVAFRQMRHSIMVTQTYDVTGWPDGRTTATLNDFTHAFDVPAFAEQMAGMGVEYVVFTAWHKSIYLLAPNNALERWLPGHTAQRDLVGEIADALQAKNIKLVIYAHPNDGHDLTPAEQTLVGYNDPAGSYQVHNNFINEVYGELCDRYAGKPNVLGFWWDSWNGNNGRIDMPRLRNTVIAKFPGAITLSQYFNPSFIDFNVGESGYGGSNIPSLDALVPMNVSQCFCLLNDWASVSTNSGTISLNSADLYRYVLLNVGCGAPGGVNWALSPLADGKTWPGNNQPLRVMQELGGRIAPLRSTICNVLPSNNWVLPSGTIWSHAPAYVAARSPSNNVEYVHVLKPPAGRFMDLPMPVESFSAARLHLSQRPVAMAVTNGGSGNVLRLTLPDGEQWDALDTVIELVIDGYVVPGGPSILTFDFGSYGRAAMSGLNITKSVPPGTNLTALAPTFTLTAGATCVPPSGSTRDFSQPVKYVVTAADPDGPEGPEVPVSTTFTVTVTPMVELVPTLSARADGYTVATFSNEGSGVWTVPADVTSVEVLAVGGGGCGGAAYGGGGGGGGVVYQGPESVANYLLESQASHAVTPGAMVTVAVGAGAGKNTTGTNSNGNGGTCNGANSQFDTVIAYGGQGGYNNSVSSGSPAKLARGGWAGYAGYLASTSNLIQGCDGGQGHDYTSGGGAGGSGLTDGHGGEGLRIGITGTPTYYGGGGGALLSGVNTSNLGGAGGGGYGSAIDGGAPADGLANTGGGGGAAWGTKSGGAGGSGVVIVAYRAGLSNTFAVRFETNGGSAVASQQVVAGGKAIKPATDPTKAGYGFVGWYSDAALTTLFDFSNNPIVAPTTVYAKWANVFTPTYSVRADGYTVATFANVGSGVWTVPAGVSSVEVLVVGGGGAGGSGYAGAGGGGGVVYCGPESLPGYLLTPRAGYAVSAGQSVAVSVGAGAPTATGSNRSTGANSVFDTLTAYGGQGGSSNDISPAGRGGAAGWNGTTNVQGYPGFANDGNSYTAGGGAGGAAISATGCGGVGLQIGITGVATYYGGGGGGILADGNTTYLGGLGGGGNGSQSDGAAATAGAANTGGGGGGQWGHTGSGGGGCGIVVVAYRVLTGYDVWKTGSHFAHPFSDIVPSHDPDGDGLTNQQEFAFGLDPTTGASANPIIAGAGLSNRNFSYTRFAASGLTYTVWTSPDLQHWTRDEQAGQVVGPVSEAGVATVVVTLSAMPSGGSLFVRVAAE